MDRNLLVINTLVFKDYFDKGYTQDKFFNFVFNMDVRNIEVRREYIKNFNEELGLYRNLAKKMKLNIFYSIPDTIFKNGKVDEESLNGYFEEARTMNCKNVKFSIGDYKNFNSNLKKALETFMNYGINVNVENDQTYESGTLANIIKFLTDCKAEKINIGYVYDAGNWRWVNENELENAATLKDFTRYVHLKDVKKTSSGNEAFPLDEGNIEWRRILDILPKDINVGLEYPCENNSVVKEGIKKLLQY